MGNPYLDRLANKKIGATGRKAEKRAAKSLGARLTPASGAAQSKGDMSRGEFLIEHKSTVQESMGLKRDWLEKIEREALFTGKSPALMIDFLRPSGDAHPAGRWVLVQESVFKEILDTGGQS